MGLIQEKKYYEEINLARGIGMVLVVLGHAFPDSSLGISNQAGKLVFEFIYSFHMALFIFLSGFVSSKVVKIVKLKDKFEYIKLRFKRLMVPYICVAIAFTPLKVLLSRFANVEYNFSTFWRLLGGDNPNYAMWTLYVLFILSLLSVCFINTNNIKIALIVSLALSVISFILPKVIVGFDSTLRYSFFYFAGIFFRENYDKIKFIVCRRTLGFTAMSALFLLNLLYEIASLYMNSKMFDSVKIFTGVAGIISVLFISVKICATSDKALIRRLFNIIGNYSMEIYILSTFIQPAVRILLWSLLSLNYIICVFLSWIAGIVISILLSKGIINKLNIAKKLLLGA